MNYAQGQGMPAHLQRYVDAADEYYLYCKDSGSIATSSTGLIQIPFNHNGYVIAVGSTALMTTTSSTALITPQAGNRDAYTIQIRRQNNSMLSTQENLATSIFGIEDPFIYLVKPWRVSRGETLECPVTNKNAATAITVYVTFHLVAIAG